MNTYEVLISEPAEADIDTTYEYLFFRSPSAADRFHEGIVEAIRSLTQFPQRCPLAHENKVLGGDIRQLIYRYGRTGYRILFTVFEAEGDRPALVRILRVRHGAQQRLGQKADQTEERD